MTARIKTEDEALADLEAKVDALAAEYAELAARADTIGRRLTELRSLLDPNACPCAPCATAKKYAAGAS